jgi:hypothetical protein
VVKTIIRRDLQARLVQIVGQDVDAGVAEAMVACGQAEWGVTYAPPRYVFVLVDDLVMAGGSWPAGTQLTVGEELTESQAVMLLRAGVVSAPGGGVG